MTRSAQPRRSARAWPCARAWCSRKPRRRPGRLGTAGAALLCVAATALGAAPVPAAIGPGYAPAGPGFSGPPPPAPDSPGGLAGTVALSNCSGAVVRLPRSRPADPALALTNGHCLPGRVPQPGEARADEPAHRTLTLLDVDGDALGTLRADRLLYATVTGTDVAVYRLTSTYAAIRARHGAVPRTLAARRPAAGTAIEIPAGYWKHVYRCAIDGVVPLLREGRWTMADSLRYTPECATVGGTSGAPVVDRATGRVVGVNSTGNDEGGRCTVHNPCEVGADGTVTVRQGTNYGQQTSVLTRCFRPGGTLDLDAPGCSLPRP
ncbi:MULTISPECIES: trypsin-like peptidase domain-containing protein [unclassified Streptomyces]|uniref:trypsin-like peptidase domain-containing protein n=1 Tax=unclassified Streptomyces TaxID=2593676 RepID=UPI0022B621E7|nr:MULTISPECIES: serine protease [unclassified Streptomyces]MCZ7416799.1 serine protease [Streptomyces sp. WMMC897]MCZ7433391.1 serine protease [Streptomyces sp. WMMC1477]